MGTRRLLISASRRTDIPALYADWFAARLDAGYCLVPNPRNRRQVARVSLRAEDVLGFVFWTRHVRPFLPVLERLERRGDPFYVQYTITGYGRPLERRTPPLEVALRTFRELAARIGPERVIWRYDPIVLGEAFAAREHRARFGRIARALEGHTQRVVVSVLDLYRKTRRRLLREAGLRIGGEVAEQPESEPALAPLLADLAAIGRERGMQVEACAEAADYSALGIRPTRCVDGELFSRLWPDRRWPRAKDRGQRPLCRCVESRDIGQPDSCTFGCTYCYATAADRRQRVRCAHLPALRATPPAAAADS